MLRIFANSLFTYALYTRAIALILSYGTIYRSLCAQVTWSCMECPIARLNHDRRLSLKAGVRGTFIKSVIMAKIKTNESVSRALDQDWTDGISCVSSSHVMWQNLSTPSPIQQPRLNQNDSHSCVSLEPLIKYYTLYQTIMTKFAIN